MLDIPYILDSFHKLSEQYVTEPFLKQWIDMLSFFSGYPAAWLDFTCPLHSLTLHKSSSLSHELDLNRRHCVPRVTPVATPVIPPPKCGAQCSPS